MTPQTKFEIVRVGLGIVTLGYAAYCVARGWIGMSTLLYERPPLSRNESPLLFWCAIALLIFVALAMMFDPQLVLVPRLL